MYFINLNEDGSIDDTYDKTIYLQRGSNVRLFLPNRRQLEHPILVDSKYTHTKNVSNSQVFKLNDSGDWQLDVTFTQNGSILVQILWLQEQDVKLEGVVNYFIVQSEHNLSELTIQTVLPYCLGKFEEHEQQLRSQIALGYGAFHFPPIQKLGQSPSLYAINDQHKLNPEIYGNLSLPNLKTFLSKFDQTKFFVDVLLNHTAFDSEWLIQDGFENATFNEYNSPHLKCAIELDEVISSFSNDLATGQYPEYPKLTIDNALDVSVIMTLLEHKIRNNKFEEYFLMDIDTIISDLRVITKLKENIVDQEDDDPNIFIQSPSEKLLVLLKSNIINRGANRYGVKVNLKEIQVFVNAQAPFLSYELIRQYLTFINKESNAEVEGYIKEILNSTRGQISYYKVELQNHKISKTAKGDDLVPRYFTKLQNGISAANNGWIQGFDPLNNFAEGNENHYFRRTIVIWGDLIKLRYGNSKKDCPALWNYMKKYVQSMAQTFHGLRLDNAHSTPLWVGEYMMRKARKVNSEILVFAELFTGSPEKDSIFTKRFGFNCLVRETNRCFDVGQLNRELHYYAGDGISAVGSIDVIMKEGRKELRPRYAPALIYEQSHDNESIVSSHGKDHLIGLSALIALSNCMGGTIRTYDQFIPYRLSVVTERRRYSQAQVQTRIGETKTQTIRFDTKPQSVVEIIGSWSGWNDPLIMKEVSPGIYVVDLQLNIGEYEYKYRVDGVWQCDPDKEIRHNNHSLIINETQSQIHSTMESIRELLNRLKQQKYPWIYTQMHGQAVQSISRHSITYEQSNIVIAKLNFGLPDPFTVIQLPGIIDKIELIAYMQDDIKFNESQEFIEPSTANIIQHQNIREFADIHFNHETQCHVLKFTSMPPSFTAIISCINNNQYLQQIQTALDNLDQHSQLSAQQLNYTLFVSEPEEHKINNQGLYSLPNYRPLIYAGLAGPLSPVLEVSKYNNLAHPLCHNLRHGNWLVDFLNDRIQKAYFEDTKTQDIINNYFTLLKHVPRYLIPAFFCRIILKLVNDLTPKKQNKFQEQLQLACYQFLALDNMSAGLPHFTIGWARCWGRDTFISFRGIYLFNGLIAEARYAIIKFASALRHGLIPNLLDDLNNPRYNCRDACWWFIKAIRDFIVHTKSSDILKEKVNMIFLDDDSDKHLDKKSKGVELQMTLSDIIQSIFQSHASGIKFREWKAGNQIDEQMNSEGFNICLELDEETGFIIGGNWRNCLTWMDKMGSYGDNKGLPATSRDGAPIEMTAILKLCLDFAGQYLPQEGVKFKNKTLNYKEWAKTIQRNFCQWYWVQKQCTDKNVRKHQIYKDLCKSSKPRNEFQLRCNASIAIALAPELFPKQNAAMHLAIAERYLKCENSLGLKTLDPSASEYVHYYDNNDESTFHTAHGFSYHNGPEWVWVYGYFLKALLSVHNLNKELFYSYLSRHKEYIQNNEWFSLPEMTNGNGEYNHFSCRAQAWSIAVLLEVVYDFEHQ